MGALRNVIQVDREIRPITNSLGSVVVIGFHVGVGWKGSRDMSSEFREHVGSHANVCLSAPDE